MSKIGFPLALAALIVIVRPASSTRPGQGIVENAERPASPRADRRVLLREVLRIVDEGGRFYFKYPYGIDVGPDGSIYVLEPEQFLKFDKTGTFVRNLYKKGQGPGEVQFIWGFVPTEGRLWIHGVPNKLLLFNDAGALVKEIPLRLPFFGSALAAIQGGRFIFTAKEDIFKFFKSSKSEIQIPHYVLDWREGQDPPRVCGEFGVATRAMTHAGIKGISYDPQCDFHIAPIGSGRLAVSHTPEYLVKIFEPETSSVVRSFRRPYRRIKFRPPAPPKRETGMMVGGGERKPSPLWPKYAADIAGLFPVAGKIWVLTSTQDKDQNPLIDVFDTEGRYLDRFILVRPAGAPPLPRESSRYLIRAGYFYVSEQDEDGMYAIVKYEIPPEEAG